MLQRPDGQEINVPSADDNAGGNKDALIEVMLPQTGMYTVIARSSNYLSSGDYKVRLDLTNCGRNQFRATYFNNRNLAGNHAYARCESSIDHKWFSDSPNSRINPEAFSSRWQGTFYIDVAGDYTFTVHADDGVRLWVDKTKILDEWQRQVATFTVTRYLSQGNHVIRMDHNELNGWASAGLSWSLTSPTTASDASDVPLTEAPQPTPAVPDATTSSTP